MSEVNAFRHTFYDEDVARDKAVSEATQAKIAEMVMWLGKNAGDYIGKIETAFLTEEQFAQMKDYALLDGGGSPIAEADKKWVLHKGQSIVGSDFSNLKGVNTLSNLVATEAHIAQALNDGTLGTYQESQNKAHNHYLAAFENGTYSLTESTQLAQFGGTSDSSYDLKGVSTAASRGLSSSSGGAVARPNRVMYNIFIKINW